MNSLLVGFRNPSLQSGEARQQGSLKLSVENPDTTTATTTQTRRNYSAVFPTVKWFWCVFGTIGRNWPDHECDAHWHTQGARL